MLSILSLTNTINEFLIFKQQNKIKNKRFNILQYKRFIFYPLTPHPDKKYKNTVSIYTILFPFSNSKTQQL